MTRGGSKQRPMGERRCIVDGVSGDRSALIRFVLSPENIVTPDILEKLEGRGVWVSAHRDNITKAITKNAFAHGFKKPVTIGDNLLETTESQLTKRLISLISMARKAGDAISGAQKVKNALQNGEVRLIFQASDGSPREKRNLSYRNQVDYRYEMLNRQELGIAFSKESVVHAALTGEGFLNRVRDEANRLQALRQANCAQS